MSASASPGLPGLRRHRKKPVGTVSIAVAADDGADVRTFQFSGGRDMVKFQASQTAMNILRLMLMHVGGVREWAERR